MIATYKKAPKKDVKGQEYGYFEDVRNLNGDILYYPNKFGKVKIFSLHRNSFLTNDFWQVNVKVAPRQLREKINNPFLLILDNTTLGKPKLSFVDKLNKEKLIRKIFEETGSTSRDAKNTSYALLSIMGDLYTETERFIFELLQNADDQPQDDSLVNVTLKTLNENLLFMHSGKPFSEADVESISSIGDSTKKADSEKTGYKGIGFKSVFSDAETVFIDSGNFSFAFDKKSPLYSEEKDMDVIPWQIKPIWEEKYRLPKEVQEESIFFSSPVGIALNVGVETINKYDEIIPNLLSEPRFALFLRNVGRIRFENINGDVIEIEKSILDNIVRIKSNEITEDWLIKDYIIDIPTETQEALRNEKLVPKKLKEATKTKITFAAKIVNGNIVPVNDAVLFTYLPTKVDDFGFKFLINADFLTTASRESIHYKNIWNRFLFSNIGTLLVDWVSTLQSYCGSLCLLPLQKYEGDNILFLDFYDAFQKAIADYEFIKGHNGAIVSQEKIMIDRSGLSKIIGKDLFCSIIDSTRFLPDSDEDEDALRGSEVFEAISKVTTISVLSKIYDNSSFLNWFKEVTYNSKCLLFDWLVEKENDKHRNLIIKVVENLPLYCFDDNFLFKDEISSTQIVVRNAHAKLVPIYKAIGLNCSNNIDELPIAKFYSEQIVESSIEYTFKHLSDNHNFSTWITSAKAEDVKTLTDWLETQDTSTQYHNLIINFIESLPIFIFDNANCKKSDIIHVVKKPNIVGNQIVSYSNVEKLDDTLLLITNKLSGIVSLLSKIGFVCSNNIDESPFSKFISPIKEADIYNLICEKVNSAMDINQHLLTPAEKLSLFCTLKELDGIGDVKLSQNYIFINQSHTHRLWLSNMAVYSPELPYWMYEYTICEEESFNELIPYLVKKENIFDNIIKSRIAELSNVVSLKDIYIAYKDDWTLSFTQKLINEIGITDAIVEMVEEQDNDSKKYLLNKLVRLNIDLTQIYTKDDIEYRIINLAFEVYTDDEIRSFAKKIFVEERPVSSYTISENITIDYHEGKCLTIPLAKLLPEYEESGMTNKIKGTLSNFSDFQLERLLSLKPMSSVDAWNKYDVSKGHTPYSYLLGIYRTRKLRGYYNNYVPNVDLSKENQTWVHSLLNIMFEQNVELHNDSFGYRLSNYFKAHFRNEYLNEDEIILSSIESWADTDEKRKYLISLGVKSERSHLIKFRKNLIDNVKIDTIDIESQKENITSTIMFLKNAQKLPLNGDNQITALLQFAQTNKLLSIVTDISLLEQNSKEYDLQEYSVWKGDNTIKIYIYEGVIPKRLVKTNDNNLLLCTFNEGDYYFDSSQKILYISKKCEPRDLLYNIVSVSNIPFKSEDWQQLFYDNLVAKEVVENKQKEIDELKDKLDLYVQKYGELKLSTYSKTDEEVQSEDDKSNDNSKNTNIKTEQTPDDKPSADITGNSGSASKRDKYAAQLEAQQFLMTQRPDWTYPKGFGECNEEGIPTCFSTFSVRNEKDEIVPIVLKSYKVTSEPFRINPEEWESVAVDSAKLLVYTYINHQLEVVEVPQTDLVKNQPYLTISFSTENLDNKEHEDRLSKFAEFLHYFKELTFDFTSFHVSPDAIRVKDIYAKKEGTVVSATTEDL